MKRDELIQSSNMKFPDNSSGAIAPSAHRAFNNQMIDVIFGCMPKYYVSSMDELQALAAFMEIDIPVEINVYVLSDSVFPVGMHGDREIYFPANTPDNSRMNIYMSHQTSDRLRFMLNRGGGESGFRIEPEQVGIFVLISNTVKPSYWDYNAAGNAMTGGWIDM